jgi:predicted alpha/beta hydrolase family esterase
LAPFLAEPDQSPRFDAWIEELRDAQRLHNDDVTLVAIEI